MDKLITGGGSSRPRRGTNRASHAPGRTTPPPPPPPTASDIALYRSPDRESFYEIPSRAQVESGLWVSSAGSHRRMPPNPYVQDRVLDCYAAVLITRGEGEWSSPGTGRRRVQGGSVLWVTPGVRHSYTPGPAPQSWDEHWVVFGGRMAECWERQGVIDSRKPVVEVGRGPAVAGLFAQIAAAMAEGGPLAGARGAALLHGLVITVHGHATGFEPGLAAAGTGDAAAGPVAQAAAIIRREATLGLTPAAVAARVHCAYSTLRRNFKRQTGSGIKEYILRMQLRQAKELLALTALPVGSVAQEAGFEDRLYFSRVFQAREGQSPRAFRRAHRRRP